MPDHDINPDRAQVRDLGAVDHRRPIMADLGAIPGVIGVSPTDADVRRLQDEVAYLTRDRDRWRERAELIEDAAKGNIIAGVPWVLGTAARMVEHAANERIRANPSWDLKTLVGFGYALDTAIHTLGRLVLNPREVLPTGGPVPLCGAAFTDRQALAPTIAAPKGGGGAA